MLSSRPYVMSIAGFDPSAGAGVLADIKCFEQHKVYGFGICSALTVQTDRIFVANEWLDAPQIINQLRPLLAQFKITACKIGLIKDIAVLQEVTGFLKAECPWVKIVVDPIFMTSTGFEFHNWGDGLKTAATLLEDIDLVTPNYPELLSFGGSEEVSDVWKLGKQLAGYCPVLLKGGHSPEARGTDYLFEQERIYELKSGFDHVHQKHGSGCVLSAAIAANIALGHDLKDSCRNAKLYIERFLNSSTALLGYHTF